MATDVQVFVQDESGHVVVEDTSVAVISIYEDQQVVVETNDVHVVAVGEQGPPGAQGPAGIGAGNFQLSLEAGENLVVGKPVWVNANKLYIADNTTNYKVVGVVTTAALTGLLATAAMSGSITLSGLATNAPYFLGNGIITNSPPSSGYVVKVGHAISGTTLLLNIEEPILLS